MKTGLNLKTAASLTLMPVNVLWAWSTKGPLRSFKSAGSLLQPASAGTWDCCGI